MSCEPASPVGVGLWAVGPRGILLEVGWACGS